MLRLWSTRLIYRAAFDPGERFQAQWDDGSYSTVELDGEDGAATVTVTHAAGKPPAGWLLDLQDLRTWLDAHP